MKDQEMISKEQKLEKKDEVDLISLAKVLLEGRKTIIRIVFIFALLGLSLALFTEKEYTASTIMVPQVNNPSSELGGLSSLASLAGFNMDMNSGANSISPVLYPMIFSSASFQLEIMNAEYLFEKTDGPLSLIDYYLNEYKPGLFGTLKKYTIGLPGLIISAFQDDQLDSLSDGRLEAIKLTADQDEVRKIIEKNLSLEVNQKDGYLILFSRFHQAHLSAQLAQKSQKLLQDYVTELKVEKAKAQMEFIKERYEENKSEFEDAQSKLANFRDANKNISSEIMRTHEERLQNEYQLAFDVYSELAQQLEQSMIKVEEDTPVFSVIKEVVVPIEKSKPKRSMILLVNILLGGLIGIGWVFGSKFIRSLRRQWVAESDQE